MAGISKNEKFLRMALFEQGFKRCSSCGKVKAKEDFGVRKDSLTNLVSNCKDCLKAYRDSRIDVRAEYDKKYLEKNRDRKYINNKINNRSLCTNKDFIDKINNKDPKYCAFLNESLVTIKCYNCNNYYTPIVEEIKNFIKAPSGYANIYCSDVCKNSCKVYNFKTTLLDPESSLYIEKSEKQKARACQTDYLKQLQLDECSYNYCEKCGTKVETVELHHTLEVAKYGLKAISSASHILLCSRCHKELTRQCEDSV